MRSTAGGCTALVAIALGLIGAGCGSGGIAWTTWYSGACDARFDMPGPPVSSYEVSPHTLGQQSVSIHREDAEASRFVYSCRTFPQGHLELKGAGVVAEDVIRHELRAFDAGWKVGELRDVGTSSKGVTLTRADGVRADIRAVAVPGLSQTHATLTVGVGIGVARRFVEAIEIRPKPKSGSTRVRSAECHASVVMPGVPEGSFANQVITHVHKDALTSRLYVLRCVFLDEMLRKRTPGEIFAQSVADTTASGEWKAGAHTDFELDGRYAREQHYVSGDGARILAVRIAVDGARLQLASFTGKLGDDQVAEAFLKSYRLHGRR
ncbi:MAG: hypothetical protein IT385_00625 [Deltaproteobacteria bacterium]|nr:hypothetical protein [Deltaproteobacteria bacterium]